MFEIIYFLGGFNYVQHNNQCEKFEESQHCT